MIKSTIPFKQGDVILIPFPFTDFSTLKQRPAVILSGDKFNQTHQDVIVAAISSTIPAQLEESDYFITPNDLKSSDNLRSKNFALSKVFTTRFPSPNVGRAREGELQTLNNLL